MRRAAKARPSEGIATMRSAWRRSYPGLAAIAVFSVLVNLLKLATPLYVLQILDRITASRSVETLIMLTVITLAAILTSALLEAIRRRMFAHWGAWIERHFGPKLVHAGLSFRAQHACTPSKVLRDLSTIRSFVSGSGVLAWLDVVWAPLFVAVVYLIDPTLCMIVLGAIVGVLGLGVLNEILTRPSRNASRRALVDGRDWVTTAERNSETIKPLNMASTLTERWSEHARERLDEGLRTRRLTVNMTVAMRFLGRCLRIALLAVGIWLVVENVLTLGAVIAAGILGRTAFRSVERAMLKWRELVITRGAYSRLHESLSVETSFDVSVPDHQLPVPLIATDLSYRYPNEQASVLRRINVAMNPGEILCVIGPSASGKTTFSRVASGLLRPRSGSIRLGDIDVARLPQDGPARYVGYLPQDIHLFRGTVRENIARMDRGDFNDVLEAAQLIGIHDTILKLPEGYDTKISDDEPLLSAGQRKAIAVARAFYGWPQLIVMDEPEPHLDRRARRSLVRGLKACTSQGSIVVVTSQSKVLSRIADKVVLLDPVRTKVLD
ncbi:MAG: type I secretion system permease/ATPase, partial [Geminicoccaceae bacterium]